MAKKRSVAAKSAIQQHIEQLRALDRQFKSFEAKLREAIRANPSLKSIERDLDKTLRHVQGPAYGLPTGTVRRAGR